MNLSNKILYSLITIAVILIAIAILVYYLVLRKENDDIVLDVINEEEVLVSLSSDGNQTISQIEMDKILQTLTANEN